MTKSKTILNTIRKIHLTLYIIHVRATTFISIILIAIYNSWCKFEFANSGQRFSIIFFIQFHAILNIENSRNFSLYQWKIWENSNVLFAFFIIAKTASFDNRQQSLWNSDNSINDGIICFHGFYRRRTNNAMKRHFVIQLTNDIISVAK